MKKILYILIIISLLVLNSSIAFCSDKDIDHKLNRFISNQTESKKILAYIECNHNKLENKKIKKSIINKFIDYNEDYIKSYQKDFDSILDNEIKNIQSRQNLKSEINMLNKLYRYEDICKHEFRFIDNKPSLVKSLKDIYCSGYKISFIKRKFILEVNYEFLENAY